ncbi:MAG: glycerate-2-kinase family protein, partial [Planctomycetales bacterium]|nr:glycerate-2-kinase family protein [Planctomycetales bacterium]
MGTPRPAEQLRGDALAIWRAGVDAIDPLRLLPQVVRAEHGELSFGEHTFDLRDIDRILIVGGGKAGAGMAVGLENALGEELLRDKQVTGLLSVPADCLTQQVRAIRLAAGRPAGVNEPRPEGAAAAEQMLRMVGGLTQRDLCICLLSGGGSALLPAPIPGITLEEKAEVTRLLSGAGANIEQLNAVRKQLSLFKGGGLARACRAGQLVTLIISDVLGDPLDVIASGPTVENRQTFDEAIAVFSDLGVQHEPVARRVLEGLRSRREAGDTPAATSQDYNLVIANNATAVDAAGMEAERRGYSHAMICASASEDSAEEVGAQLAAMALHMRDRPGPDCLISGGE